MEFVVVRLGKNSVSDINRINDPNAYQKVPFSLLFKCSQVEDGIDVGDFVILWLGSDNNKGTTTQWKQGVRAIARILSLKRGSEFNDESEFELQVVAVLRNSVDQIDFLDKCASFYKYFSKYPVVGVKSSRNNAIQKVNEGSRQKTEALLSALDRIAPELSKQLADNAPELLKALRFVPIGGEESGAAESSLLDDSDEIWSWAIDEILHKGERNFLFLGAPGTGKTWYARELAKKLCEHIDDRVRFVQFHPSFSYDDFVEGFVPKLSSTAGAVEYKIESKHFLELCEKAIDDESNFYVIVIDELTRGDPSRVLGELLTYMEVSYRDTEFSLTYSGKKSYVPKNVIVIATANPYDRSVGELDDALIRRFLIREFHPDQSLLEKHLIDSGISDAFVRRLLHVFNVINQSVPNGFGHAHFWRIKNEKDFSQLWNSKLKFLLNRNFQFEDDAFAELIRGVHKIFPSLEGVPENPISDLEDAIDEPHEDN